MLLQGYIVDGHNAETKRSIPTFSYVVILISTLSVFHLKAQSFRFFPLLWLLRTLSRIFLNSFRHLNSVSVASMYRFTEFYDHLTLSFEAQFLLYVISSFVSNYGSLIRRIFLSNSSHDNCYISPTVSVPTGKAGENCLIAHYIPDSRTQ